MQRQRRTAKGSTAMPARRGAKAAAWKHLQLLERLEVGPVRLDPHRLVAPYTVVRNG